jgi:hypothetical protein
VTEDRVSPRWLLIGGIAAVSALRLYECSLLPVETGDVVRNLLYGVAVGEYGLSAAGRPLAEISAGWTPASWSSLPFNYPPVALAFFAAVAAISPTVFAAKLALTALEAANAWLIHRLCDSRWLGLAYWASPMSIWWVSREGQFEPLQSTLTLLALLGSARFPLPCGAALALAISVKMTAAALLPWLAYHAWKAGRRALGLAALGFALGALPALGAELAYGGISNVFRFSSPLVYNPYYWDWTARMFSWNPGWLIAANQLASYGMLAALFALAVRSRDRLAFLAPIAFVLFCKLHTNVQFWYFVFLPALLVPIPESRARFGLIAACPLLDVRSALQLVFGPFGQRGYRGLRSVFDLFLPPPR